MITVEIPTRLTLDDLFKAMEQLPAEELTRLIQRALALQAERRIDEEETALLTVIHYQLSPDQQARLEQLRSRSQVTPLTPAEQSELLEFVQQIEQKNLQRMDALVKLAKKRGLSLNQLMTELGIEAQYA